MKFILFVFSVIFILSCGDDKENTIDNGGFTLSSSELNVHIGDNDTIFINGEGEYTAISEDESIVSVTINDDKGIVIKPKKTGNSVITVSDTRGNLTNSTKQLIINVEERSESFYLAERILSIELDDETFRQEIRQACNEYSIMPLGNNILKFTFLSIQSGKCCMYEESSGTQLFEGEFEWNVFDIETKVPMPEPVDLLVIRLENSEHFYSIKPPIVASFDDVSATKSSDLLRGCTLIEDLTEVFKSKYPQAGIKSILSRQVIYNQSFYVK